MKLKLMLMMLFQEQEGKLQKLCKQLKLTSKEVVAKAEGEASRFISIYNEYAKAKKLLKKECI